MTLAIDDFERVLRAKILPSLPPELAALPSRPSGAGGLGSPVLRASSPAEQTVEATMPDTALTSSSSRRHASGSADHRRRAGMGGAAPAGAVPRPLGPEPGWAVGAASGSGGRSEAGIQGRLDSSVRGQAIFVAVARDHCRDGARQLRSGPVSRRVRGGRISTSASCSSWACRRSGCTALLWPDGPHAASIPCWGVFARPRRCSGTKSSWGCRCWAWS